MNLHKLFKVSMKWNIILNTIKVAPYGFTEGGRMQIPCQRELSTPCTRTVGVVNSFLIRLFSNSVHGEYQYAADRQPETVIYL